MSLRSSLLVTRKELTASLRDRQTALYTFVLPLVLYPAVFWLMIQGFLVLQGQRERTEVEVGLTAEVPLEMHAALAQELDSQPAGKPGCPRTWSPSSGARGRRAPRRPRPGCAGTTRTRPTPSCT